jgi:hypothetical protein
MFQFWCHVYTTFENQINKVTFAIANKRLITSGMLSILI